tara:strand:+ start:221 stop:778 length:558 start_codon:yes stop_codon:yes gene_type:complete
MSYYGGNDVTTTVLEFLENGTAPAISYNSELTLYRSDKSIASDDLPLVQNFHGPRILGSQSTIQGVTIGVEWLSSGEETLNNSRMILHRVALGIYVPISAFDGNADSGFESAVHYVTVMRGMFMRAALTGAYGSTLNNGGTTMPRRVNRAIIVGDTMGIDEGSNEYNYLPLIDLEVEVIGDYPGT